MSRLRTRLTLRQARSIIAANAFEQRDPRLVASPAVSVAMLTYNHASFIRQAIDSAVRQRGGFPFELVIADDASTDGTAEIALEYQRRHPEKVRVLQSRTNMGALTGNGRLNFIRLLESCRGTYIAWLDGDDYWTDEDKLGRQVDFMRENPEYTACIHRAGLRHEGAAEPKSWLPEGDVRPSLTLVDALDHRRTFAATSSILMRNLPGIFPAWALHCFGGDRVLLAALAARGPIGFLDFMGSVYRKHPGGVTTTINHFWQNYGRILFFTNVQKLPGWTPEAEVVRRAQLKHWLKTIISWCARGRDGARWRGTSALRATRYLLSPSFLGSVLPPGPEWTEDVRFVRETAKEILKGLVP